MSIPVNRPAGLTLLALLTLLIAACGGGSSSSPAPTGGPPPAPSEPDPEPPAPVAGEGVIKVLSSRADLISGGDALIEISAEDPALLDNARVTLGDTDVSDHFQSTGDTLKGLVDGMSPGSHTLRVTLADGSLLQQPVINHPKGGPVFSGPQIQPWTCNNEAAIDAQCNQPAEYRFKYVPADKLRAFITGFDPMNPGLPGAFLDYQPDNPPADGDIARVTTDQGVEVPFIAVSYTHLTLPTNREV